MKLTFIASALAVAAAAAMLLIQSREPGKDDIADPVAYSGRPGVDPPGAAPITAISPYAPSQEACATPADSPASILVEDPAGSPLPHARLLIAAQGGHGPQREYQADQQGWLPHVAGGSGAVGSAVAATAAGDFWTDPRRRQLDPGDRITVHPLDRPLKIRVFMKDRPGEGATVTLGGTTASWTTGEGGETTIHLPEAPVLRNSPGTFMKVQAPGAVSEFVSAAALATSLDVFPVFLQPARSLPGTVVDRQGRPLAGADIIGENNDIVTTGGNGEFTLPEVPIGRPSRWLLRHRQAVARIVTLPRDAVAPLRLTMESGPILRVAVRNERGDPLPRIDVHATGGSDFLLDGVTGSDGRFDFRVPRKSRISLRAGAVPYRQTELTLPVDDSDAEATLRLARLGRFSARILDDSGGPAAGARVVPSGAGGWSPPPRRTGDDGCVEFPSWPEGRVRVEVHADGFDILAAEVDPPAAHGEWTLLRSPSALIVVHDTVSGMPAADASILLPGVHIDRDNLPVLLPATQPGQRPGHYLVRSPLLSLGAEPTILVTAPGRRTEAVRLRPERVADPAPVFVDLAAGRTLQGVVRDGRSLLPVEDALVSVDVPARDGAPPRRETGRTDGEGRFRLAGLPATSLQLRFEADGYAPLLLDASAAEASVFLYPGVPVAIGLRGDWPRDAAIHARSLAEAGEGHLPILKPDERGYAKIIIPPGTWIFRIASSDARWNGMERSLELRDDDQGVVVFEPPEPTRLAGRVQLDPAGPAAGLVVQLRALASQGEVPNRKTTAGADGEFVFPDVPPGPYEVSASFRRDRGTYQGSTRIDVYPGQPPVQIVVRLRN